MSKPPRRVTYTTCDGAIKARRPHHTSHRAFLQWFESAKSRFAMPARLVNLRHDAITMALHTDAPPVIGYVLGSLSLHQIPRLIADLAPTTRAPTQETLCWIPSLAQYISRTSAGWHCTLCPPERRSVHPSREAAWITHLFEPLLAHMNHTLSEKKQPPEAYSPLPKPAPHLLRLLVGPEAGEWSLEAVQPHTHGDSKCRLHP